MNILERTQVTEIKRQADRLLSNNWKPEFPDFRISKAIVDMSREGLSGYEREVCRELAHRAGTPFDSQRITLPFALFRDIVKGTAGAGGYLVATEVSEAVDILRPFSVTARAGVFIETGLVGDVVIPKVTAKSTPNWLSTESSQITASQPTLAQIACTPHQVGIVCNFSRQLSLQANAEAFVRRELMNTVSTAIDQAVINGSGANGQPTGIINTSGVNTQSGTSLAWAGVTNMKQLIADANAPDEAIAYLGTPAVRELLENRERASGSGFIWDRDMVASRPAFVSTDVPSATLICGAWPLIYLGIWGEGFVVEINPYDSTGFKTGTIQARILLSVDLAVLHPGAFSKAESIT